MTGAPRGDGKDADAAPPATLAPWSDPQLSALPGDVEASRADAVFDRLVTAGVFYGALVVCGALTPNHLSPEASRNVGILSWLATIVGTWAFAAWRARRRREGYAEAARLRDPALRACAELLDDGHIDQDGDGRLLLEGWRRGLPVGLGLSVAPSPPAPDELVLRVGARPAPRRQRIVTTARVTAVRAIPDALNAWLLGHPGADALAADLAARFRVSVAWGPDGVELRGPADHRLLRPDRVQALLVEAARLARACGLVAATAVRLTSGAADREAWCPYCRDALESSPTTACGSCGTAHHTQCLAEHGRCTVFGCGKPVVRPVARAAEAP